MWGPHPVVFLFSSTIPVFHPDPHLTKVEWCPIVSAVGLYDNYGDTMG